eukprot:ANDGO_04242.mRNA.1 Ribosome maturation protein SBDS
MAQHFTPVNQRRHTNVAVIRYKKQGVKFEIAAYPNKVLSWRSGVEKDLDEVLQTRIVFDNVGKGEMANKQEMYEVFGTHDEQKIILEILEKGELQVAEKERQAILTQLTHDVCNIVAEKAFNPLTKRPYPLPTIERALKDSHYVIRLTKPAKQQALEVIRLLSKTMPIARSRMLVRIFGIGEAELKDLGVFVENSGVPQGAKGSAVTCLIDPEMYRVLQQQASSIEIIDSAVLEEGEKRIDQFVADDSHAKSMVEQPPPATKAAEAVSEVADKGAKHSRTEEKKLKRALKKEKKSGASKEDRDSDSDDDDVPSTMKTKKNSKKQKKSKKSKIQDSEDSEEQAFSDSEEESTAALKKKVAAMSLKAEKARGVQSPGDDDDAPEEEEEELEDTGAGALAKPSRSRPLADSDSDKEVGKKRKGKDRK